jgi:ABC-type antimicrobial peptide transport system permease subunit
MKKIILSSLVGTLVYYLLGWIVYGLLEISESSGNESMVFIFLGCLFYALVFAVIFARWAHISTLKSGFKAGFILGLLYILSWQFFVTSDGGFDLVPFVKEVLIGTLITAIMASAIAYVSGKIE